jgi:hypothetical protein
MTGVLILQLRLPAAPGAAALGAERVAGALGPLVDDGRMGPDRAADAAVLTGELVGNSLQHAGLGPADLVLISVTLLPDRVRVEVQDPGGGFRPGCPGAAAAAAGADRGIPMLRRLAARWGTDRSALMRVWFELPVAPATPRGAPPRPVVAA